MLWIILKSTGLKVCLCFHPAYKMYHITFILFYCSVQKPQFYLLVALVLTYRWTNGFCGNILRRESWNWNQQTTCKHLRPQFYCTTTCTEANCTDRISYISVQQTRIPWITYSSRLCHQLICDELHNLVLARIRRVGHIHYALNSSSGDYGCITMPMLGCLLP